MTTEEYKIKKIQTLDNVLENLLPTYNAVDDTIAIYPKLPSNEEIITLCNKLEEILFPGYRTTILNGHITFDNLIKEVLDEIYNILYEQVKNSLPFRWAREYAKNNTVSSPLSATEERRRPLLLEKPAPTYRGPHLNAKAKNILNINDLEMEAELIVSSLLEKLPFIRAALKRDVLAAYNGDPAATSYAEIILSYPGLRAIAIYRIAHELYKFNVPLIPRMMTEYAHAEAGIDIHPGAEICESFFIDHGTGVVIGETCRIGNRVKIYQGVTLGAKSFSLDAAGNPIKGIKRHPDIEDDVIIYAGATILGGDTVIGKGSVIGGNVWVTESIPPYSVVVQKNAEIEIKNANHKKRNEAE